MSDHNERLAVHEIGHLLMLAELTEPDTEITLRFDGDTWMVEAEAALDMERIFYDLAAGVAMERIIYGDDQLGVHDLDTLKKLVDGSPEELCEKIRVANEEKKLVRTALLSIDDFVSCVRIWKRLPSVIEY